MSKQMRRGGLARHANCAVRGPKVDMRDKRDGAPLPACGGEK